MLANGDCDTNENLLLAVTNLKESCHGVVHNYLEIPTLLKIVTNTNFRYSPCQFVGVLILLALKLLENFLLDLIAVGNLPCNCQVAQNERASRG